ncbi:N-carbamoyl-D-amino-acid hydrolase [Martelella lutilitoris]|uniref:N-carbamoyl-D-amino-acid hydrolase n=1 Tax=Martelella lutilitoris TaxID=2583532 RepID=A0A5C4JUI9_9HYPH|nr:N-carbamoyl-D-amino-acid hydrolase [Martelella lutilitoris]TNB48957.1 N-carbamoyl-D-amino-acid hydrolase [Martelella lutilitoris]
MARYVVVGAAQLGPIARSETRASVVERMIALMEKAASRQCDVVAFPELALTTFFPRWFMEDQAEVDAFFEKSMPNDDVAPLFARAKELKIGFSLGYGELTEIDGVTHRYNTTIIVEKTGEIVHRYRKIHLPGHPEHEPWRPFQHLEKRYFEPGPEPFSTAEAFGGIFGQAICNDRRWPETYRELALRGAEMVLIGYNTPVHYPLAPEHDHLQNFHNHLSLQAGAYQNGMWVVGIAKAGKEEGCDLIGQSCIVAPTGEIVAMAGSLSDELITYDCDLDRCKEIRENIFNFRLHRRPELYTALTRTD